MRAEIYQERIKDNLHVQPVLLHAGYLNKEAKASQCSACFCDAFCRYLRQTACSDSDVVLPAGLVGGRAALISIGRLPEVAPLSLHRCLKLQTSLAQS